MVPPPAATAPSREGGSLLEPGTVVAGYRLERLIGQGETGVFYEATKPEAEGRCALKLLDPGLAGDPGFRERFEREGRIQTTLEHPNLVAVAEVGESEHGLFVAAELIRAPNLRELIGNERLELRRTALILGQVAGALDAVHRAGLLHGDIRPEAILVRDEGGDHAYLADFGVIEDRPPGRPAGAGTDYLAPERIRGEPPTMSTDVYALGAVLHECLLGTVPLPWEAPAQELPDDVLAVISTAMAKDPADRFATAEQLRRALDLAVGGPASEADAAPAAVDEAAPAPGRREAGQAAPRGRSVPWAATAAIAVLALAAAGFLVGRGGSSKNVSSATTVVTADGIGVQVPSAWSRITGAPRIAGVEFPGAVGFAAKRDRAEFVAAEADGEWPTLLPAALQKRVVSQSALLAGRDVVMLGTRQAFRYEDVSLRGETERPTVFAVPTGDRVELLSCVTAEGANPRLETQCERVAAGVTLPGSASYSLLPQAGYVRAVNGAVDRLNNARETGRTQLAAAKTAAAQAQAARRVGAAYGREERVLRGQKASLLVDPVNRKIVAQMGRVRAAYGALASAALGKKAEPFEAATRVVRQREAALRALFRQLRFAGISVQ